MIPSSFWRDLAVAEIEPAQQKIYAESADIAQRHEIKESMNDEREIGLRHAALQCAIAAHPGSGDDFLVSAAGNYLQFLKGNDKDHHERMQAIAKGLV